MKMIEKFSGVFFIAGLAMFFFAFITLAWIPVQMVEKLSPTGGLPKKVPEMYSVQYASVELYHDALKRGRDLYVGEGCWHCHSQFVRPTANESLRYGPVSTAAEYQNVLQMPQLLGVRRVGPDLSRESGKHTNDWHYAHLYKPTNVVPQSVMPSYSWYFDVIEGIPTPKNDAKAIVAYLQWLGMEWVDRQETQYDYEQQTLPPAE